MPDHPSQYGQRSYDLMGVYLASIWFLYLILSPIYILPKGLAQPADFILMLGMAPLLVQALVTTPLRMNSVYLAGGLFAAFTITINWVNFAFYHDMRLALSSIYYPYNFGVFLFVVALFKRNYAVMWRLTLVGVIMAIIIQAAWAAFLPDVGVKRMTAGFKNPNQLAYWALLSAAMLFFLKRHSKFKLIDWLALLLIAFIQSVALSKAGIIAFAVFIFFLSFTPQVPKLSKAIVMLVVFCGMAYALFSPQTISSLTDRVDAFERVTTRLETLGHENDDSPEGRGYNRLVNNPEYLILGAGEGAFVRFRTWASSNELHSGAATLLFSYGIVGFVLFGSFLFFIFYRQPWYCWAILFSVLLFSLSSQTLRFTHSWVFLAIAYATFIIPQLLPQPDPTITEPVPENVPPES